MKVLGFLQYTLKNLPFVQVWGSDWEYQSDRSHLPVLSGLLPPYISLLGTMPRPMLSYGNRTYRLCILTPQWRRVWVLISVRVFRYPSILIRPIQRIVWTVQTGHVMEGCEFVRQRYGFGMSVCFMEPGLIFPIKMMWCHPVTMVWGFAMIIRSRFYPGHDHSLFSLFLQPLNHELWTMNPDHRSI